jgi:3-dehydroquinate synthase
VKLGITPPEVPKTITSLVAAYGLPSQIDCDMAHYTAAVGLDKKGEGEEISLILLPELGKAEAVKLPKSEVLHLLEEFAL